MSFHALVSTSPWTSVRTLGHGYLTQCYYSANIRARQCSSCWTGIPSLKVPDADLEPHDRDQVIPVGRRDYDWVQCLFYVLWYAY